MDEIIQPRQDNEQTLELRWIPGRAGIKVFIYEGKSLVQSSFHPTSILVDALRSAYENYGNEYESNKSTPQGHTRL